MKSLFFFLLFSLIFYLPAFAQKDSTYIQKLPNNRVLGLHTTMNRMRIALNTEDRNELYFQGHTQALGIRFRIKKFGLSFPIPIRQYRSGNLQEPKSFGFSLGFYPEKIFVQADFRRHRGMNDFSSPDLYPDGLFRAGMKVTLINLSGGYVFNHKKYSLRSAFKMVNRQLRNAGSFVMTINTQYQSLSANSLAIPFDFGVDLTSRKYRSFRLGAGAGYAYTVVSGNLTVTAKATSGIGLRYLRYTPTGANETAHIYVFNPVIWLSGSIVHNGDHLFYGMTSNFRPGFYTRKGIQTRVNNFMLRLTVGWRFW